MPRLALAQTAEGLNTGQEKTIMKIRIAFDGHDFTATLYDNPSARDLASPCFRSISPSADYANNEKIAYLPRKLTDEGSGPFANELPGDLCYSPLGQPRTVLRRLRYSSGLIRLGRFDGGFEPLLTRGKFPLRVELSPDIPRRK